MRLALILSLFAVSASVSFAQDRGQYQDGHETDGGFLYTRTAVPLLKRIQSDLLSSLSSDEIKSLVSAIHPKIDLDAVRKLIRNIQNRFNRDGIDQAFFAIERPRRGAPILIATRDYFDEFAATPPGFDPMNSIDDDLRIRSALLATAFEGTGIAPSVASDLARQFVKLLLPIQGISPRTLDCFGTFGDATCRKVLGYLSRRKVNGNIWEISSVSASAGISLWSNSNLNFKMALIHGSEWTWVPTLLEASKLCADASARLGKIARLATPDQMRQVRNLSFLQIPDVRSKLVQASASAHPVWTLEGQMVNGVTLERSQEGAYAAAICVVQ